MISYCLIASVFKPPVRILKRDRAYVIGRDPQAALHVPSELVSRRHAELGWRAKGGFTVRDLGSKNGTRVNHELVQGDYALKDGDAVWVGPFRLLFRVYEGDLGSVLEAASRIGEDTTISASPVGASAPAFGGAFGGAELLELVRLIALSEKTGVLEIATTPALPTGTIGFRRGRIVAADYGEQRDAQAALSLLALPEGRFRFEGGEGGPTRVDLSPEPILMEVARIRDERSDTGSFRVVR